MPLNKPFSYNEYKEIIGKIKSRIPLLDYSDIDYQTNEFCIIRHDIEFSVERAYSLACIERDLGICSSYFVQLDNNNYNALSIENLALMKEIINMGHKIGLHYSAVSSDVRKIESEIKHNINIPNHFLDTKINRFSYHRPNLNQEILESNIKIKGLINAYSDLYFHYFKETEPKNLRIKYLSDSNHEWKYGHPLDVIKEGHKKIHILAHPFSWSPEGGDNQENYIGLVSEKKLEMLSNINSEISNFPISYFLKEAKK